MARDTLISAPDFNKFFSDRARAFRDRDFDTVADAICIPMPVYIMNRMLVINALDDALMALNIYRCNLDKTPYFETRTEVLAVHPLGERRQRVHTRTSNYDQSGACLSCFEAEYYVQISTDAAQAFKIVLIQVDKSSDDDDALIEGLPLI